MRGIAGVRMGRRDIRRSHLGDGSGSGDGLAGRRHHRARSARDGILLACSSGRSGRDVLRLVTPSRVGVVVNARVPGQLVGTAETLGAPGVLAGMRLLARMRSDVSGLVLETVEGSIAERALVGTREVLSHLFGGRPRTLHERR